MIRFIIKRHIACERIVSAARLETIDVAVPELEAALLRSGCDIELGNYDIPELVGVEVFPMSVVTESPVCGNCGEPEPGCGGLFATDGKACQFHGTNATTSQGGISNGGEQ